MNFIMPSFKMGGCLVPMLQWAEARHGHGTRAARGGALIVTTTDHKFPLNEGAWGLMLYSFRRASTAGFSGMYGAFRCEDGGIGSVGAQGAGRRSIEDQMPKKGP